MAQKQSLKPSRRVTVFTAVMLMPSTLVMFAINLGFLYLAWSVGWVLGLLVTATYMLLLIILGVATARGIRKGRLLQADKLPNYSLPRLRS